MNRRRLLGLGLAAMVTGACSAPEEETKTPGLVPRGTTMTTVKPSRQDVVNKVSLSGKVTLSPIFGLVAPVNGQVRYVEVAPAQGTPTKPTRVAAVWAGSKRHYVEVPAGATFSSRLVDDRSTVTAGMPIVSAKYAGYGIVAEIDGGQAYKIADALGSVQAQIQGGPGPFACSVLGTIAALPGVESPAQPSEKNPLMPTENNSAPSGLKLVCTPPANVRMINGANATLELVTAKAVNVIVLPVEAVAGGQGNGKVDIVRPDRTRETRDVVLGLTDGRFIEIKSGLTGDETVAVPGPNLPAAKVDPQGEPGFRMVPR